MNELWESGRSDFKGDFFQMDDCRCLPMPTAKIPIICAAQSDSRITGINLEKRIVTTMSILICRSARTLYTQAQIHGRAYDSYTRRGKILQFDCLLRDKQKARHNLQSALKQGLYLLPSQITSQIKQAFK